MRDNVNVFTEETISREEKVIKMTITRTQEHLIKMAIYHVQQILHDEYQKRDIDEDRDFVGDVIFERQREYELLLNDLFDDENQ